MHKGTRMRQMQQNMHPPPPSNNCKSGALRKCVNCTGSHASTNKSCPVLKEHIKGLFENKETQSYIETHAKQQKQLHDNQQRQENRITSISSHQTNIETLENTVNAQQDTINKQTKEIKILYNLKNKLTRTLINTRQTNQWHQQISSGSISKH